MTQVVLREFREADLDEMVAAFADPEMTAWYGAPKSREELAASLPERNDRSTGDRFSWAVEHEGRMAGAVSLFHVDHDQGDGEHGYWVAPWARRRGVGRAALLAAAAYGFETLDLHRLQLFHAVGNTGSCGVATSAGFRLEGTLRESHRFGPERRHLDEHLHGRLATDPRR